MLRWARALPRWMRLLPGVLAKPLAGAAGRSLAGGKDEYIGLRLRRNRGGLTVPRGGRPSGPGRVKKKTVR